jgi:BlaI family transcriptional regulator, penicillinase repressor
MARRTSQSFTEVELEFMRILWENGDSSPEAIRDALSRRGRSLSGGSIRNMLAIMMEKGYVSRRKEGKAYFYKVKIREDEARVRMVGDLVKTFFSGSESLLVASLLDTRDIRPDEMEEIEALIADHKRREKP